MDEFDLLDCIVNAKPVVFAVDGAEFALRQPTPAEMDRLRFAQTRAYDQAYSAYVADGLGDAPITAGAEETLRLYLEALEADYQRANEQGDGAEARRAAEEMDTARQQWPQSLAEERARDHSRRVTARWMLDNLLTGDRDELRRLGAPDSLKREEVIAAVQRMFSIINHDPNLNRRTQ